MFFQPHYSPAVQSGPYHHTRGGDAALRRRLRDVEEREQQALDARNHLTTYIADIQQRMRDLDDREHRLQVAQRQLEVDREHLRRRVAVIDAADCEQALASSAVLQNASAKVVTRAVLRAGIQRRGKQVLGVLRVLGDLDGCLQRAVRAHSVTPNLPLLEDTLTKLLERADAISVTSTTPVPDDRRALRTRRKRFVRRTMAVLDKASRGESGGGFGSDDDDNDGGMESDSCMSSASSEYSSES